MTLQCCWASGKADGLCVCLGFCKGRKVWVLCGMLMRPCKAQVHDVAILVGIAEGGSRGFCICPGFYKGSWAGSG
eukprot:1145320-Pelagomonas_calceolata.AAC.6